MQMNAVDEYGRRIHVFGEDVVGKRKALGRVGVCIPEDASR